MRRRFSLKNLKGFKKKEKNQDETGSSGCPSDSESVLSERSSSDYRREVRRLKYDEQVQKALTLGKRIALYSVGAELGVGNFSVVKSAEHILLKERVAVKIVDKLSLDARTQRLLSREIDNMEKLHHPNIIRLFEVVDTIGKLHLVLECAPGGELFTRVSSGGKMDEETCRDVFSQLASAVQHIHSKNIVHRDIKTENVFYYSSSIVKLGDFGFSTQTRFDQMLTTFCGSPPYAAPELFRDDSYVGFPVDIWAMGILLFFISTATMPFKGDTLAKLKSSILSGKFETPSSLSPQLATLLGQMLQPDPGERMGMKQVLNCDWLKGRVVIQQYPSSHATMPSQPKTENHKLAISKLRELGVADEEMKQATKPGLGSKNSVLGMYRIIMHSLEYHESPTTSSAVEDSGISMDGNLGHLKVNERQADTPVNRRRQRLQQQSRVTNSPPIASQAIGKSPPQPKGKAKLVHTASLPMETLHNPVGRRRSLLNAVRREHTTDGSPHSTACAIL